MLRERVVVVVVLLPTAFAIIALGGWIFAAAVALVLGLAAAEYGAARALSRVTTASALSDSGNSASSGHI
jgi:CDP-diglyceride synthetase